MDEKEKLAEAQAEWARKYPEAVALWDVLEKRREEWAAQSFLLLQAAAEVDTYEALLHEIALCAVSAAVAAIAETARHMQAKLQRVIEITEYGKIEEGPLAEQVTTFGDLGARLCKLDSNLETFKDCLYEAGY